MGASQCTDEGGDMSIKVMTAVFDRYPNGGGEMLLALALADHASDDGTRVYPGVKALAEKTRQSERTVQYQLRRMQETGWLILVSTGNGGRSMASEYRISPDWIKGAEIAPFKKGAIDDIKGANGSTKGCNSAQKRVQQTAPANNRQEPSENHQGTVKSSALGLIDVPDELLADWNKVRKDKKAGEATAAAVKLLQTEARKAGLTDSEAITVCCGYGWQGFRAAWYLKDNQDGHPRAPQRPQAQSFAQQDREEGMRRWEEMTGRVHPDRQQHQGAGVIDVTVRDAGHGRNQLGWQQ